MKIAIFGGGGFIGSAVADRLLLDNHDVRIFERPDALPYRSFLASERVEWRAGDFLNPHDVAGAVENMDVVLHLISFTLPRSSNDDAIFDVQTNLGTTLRLLDIMVEKKIPKVIFISSGGTVYGVPKYLPIDENHPTDPLVSYGIVKLAIEKYMMLYAHQHAIRSTILRVSNPFGGRQRTGRGQGAVTAFLNNAMHGTPIEIWGNGDVTRDYVHISDVAEAFACAIRYSGSCSVFNIGSGVGTSLLELAALIEKVVARPISFRYLGARPFDVPANVLDCNRARKELSWSPKISLLDGIRRAAHEMKTREEVAKRHSDRIPEEVSTASRSVNSLMPADPF